MSATFLSLNTLRAITHGLDTTHQNGANDQHITTGLSWRGGG
jgi:hypothetical protein